MFIDCSFAGNTSLAGGSGGMRQLPHHACEWRRGAARLRRQRPGPVRARAPLAPDYPYSGVLARGVRRRRSATPQRAVLKIKLRRQFRAPAVVPLVLAAFLSAEVGT